MQWNVKQEVWAARGALHAPGNEINDPSAKITHSYILENSTAVYGYDMIELRRGCILHVHDGTALFMGGIFDFKIGKDNKQDIFSNVIIELALYLYLYLTKSLQTMSVKLEGIKVPSGTDIHAVLCDLSSSVCFTGFVSGDVFTC